MSFVGSSDRLQLEVLHEGVKLMEECEQKTSKKKEKKKKRKHPISNHPYFDYYSNIKDFPDQNGNVSSLYLLET